MAINIYTVQQDVENEGWQLLSTSYKNLKTALEFKCPKGHLVQDTYENWRKYHICPQCAKAQGEKILRNEIPPKKEGSYRVLALDAATGTTGYSIYDDGKLVSYGTYTTIYSNKRENRINQFKHWLEKTYRIAMPDMIGIEDIQYQKNVEMYRTLANLQGVIMDFLFEHKNEVDYDFVYSSSWRSFLGINEGSARDSAKKKAQGYVTMTFNLKPTQDEADAICIGYYFSNYFYKNKETNWGEGI